MREFLSVHPDGTPLEFVDWARKESKPVPDNYHTGRGTWYSAWKDKQLRQRLERTFYREKQPPQSNPPADIS